MFRPTRGSEQAGVRPVLVVQTDRIRHKLLPSHVLVPAGEGGLTQDSVSLCEQIRVVDTTRLTSKLGELSASRLSEVDDALRTILEL